MSRTNLEQADGEGGTAAGFGECMRSQMRSAGDREVCVGGKFVLEGGCLWFGGWDLRRWRLCPCWSFVSL